MQRSTLADANGKIRISHQQLPTVGTQSGSALQSPLANRTFPQVAQAAPEDQSVLRSVGKIGQNSDLVRRRGPHTAALYTQKTRPPRL